MEFRQRLFELRDEEYAQFQAKLTPGIPPESFIGVRVPVVRKLAKEIIREDSYSDFLDELPHTYYDENMLHGLILSEMKDYETCVKEVDRFLPFVDNWAVCDIMSPKVFSRHKEELIIKIREWAKSDHVYTSRFGIEMLMSHFLDGDFRPEYLDIPAGVKLQDYYSKMMVAWFYATALAKQWDDAVKILEDKRLDEWTHNKTIQKARESYRITNEQKAYLLTLKR